MLLVLQKSYARADVTLDDASELLEFTSEFLDEVFVRPSRLSALRKKKGIK
jgi:hypothetical protein